MKSKSPKVFQKKNNLVKENTSFGKYQIEKTLAKEKLKSIEDAKEATK